MMKGFYNNDENYDFLNNIIINNHCMNAHKYLHGNCHEFSIALNNKFGYPIILWIEFNDEIEGEILVHAFNIIKHDSKVYFVDVRGITDDINMLTNEFDFSEDVNINELSLEDTLNILKRMNIPVDSLNECELIIDNYKNYYML